MRICLIGKNLSNLVLARVLANKKLNVDILYNHSKKKISQRTLSISKSNFNFLANIDKKIKIDSWPVKKIKIYNEKKNLGNLFEFQNENLENFFLIKHQTIFNLFEKTCNKIRNIKFKKLNYEKPNSLFFEKNKYDIIVNSDSNSNITKKFFNKRIEKNYNSVAYTGVINHKKIRNDEAVQIFTKFGPIAFLPFSNFETSVVFSLRLKNKIHESKVLDLIKKYNLNYKINKIGKLEKFNLKFSILRNYNYKNILSFGDCLHRIHPVAGQGFNMTIRDIKILSSLIDEKINLGLQLDSDLLKKFENKTKHLNYIFGTGIDLIYEFFQLDNKTNNFLSNSIFSILHKNKIVNKYSNYFADKGFEI